MINVSVYCVLATGVYFIWLQINKLTNISEHETIN